MNTRLKIWEWVLLVLCLTIFFGPILWVWVT